MKKALSSRKKSKQSLTVFIPCNFEGICVFLIRTLGNKAFICTKV